jgi:hypothetical protein
MQSLTEGIKFVFNNKTVLGAITLDMVAYYGGAVALPVFFTRYFKGWFRGLVFYEQLRWIF